MIPSLSHVAQKRILDTIVETQWTTPEAIDAASAQLEGMAQMVPSGGRGQLYYLKQRALATLENPQWRSKYLLRDVQRLAGVRTLEEAEMEMRMIIKAIEDLKQKTMAYQTLLPSIQRLNAALDDNIAVRSFLPRDCDQQCKALQLLSQPIANRSSRWGKAHIVPLEDACNLLFGVDVTLHGKIYWKQWDTLLSDATTLLDAAILWFQRGIVNQYGSFEFQIVADVFHAAGQTEMLCAGLESFTPQDRVDFWNKKKTRMVERLRAWPEDCRMAKYDPASGGSAYAFALCAFEYDSESHTSMYTTQHPYI